jgi:hypothetical protein
MPSTGTVPAEKAKPETQGSFCPAIISAESWEAVSNPAASSIPGKNGCAIIGRAGFARRPVFPGRWSRRQRLTAPIKIKVQASKNAKRSATRSPIPTANVISVH